MIVKLLSRFDSFSPTVPDGRRKMQKRVSLRLKKYESRRKKEKHVSPFNNLALHEFAFAFLALLFNASFLFFWRQYRTEEERCVWYSCGNITKLFYDRLTLTKSNLRQVSWENKPEMALSQISRFLHVEFQDLCRSLSLTFQTHFALIMLHCPAITGLVYHSVAPRVASLFNCLLGAFARHIFGEFRDKNAIKWLLK